MMGQSPNLMAYQLVVRDTSGGVISDSLVGVRLSIRQGGLNGGEVFAETHSVATNQNGLVSVFIGDGTLQLGSMEDIDWSEGSYYLETQIDPNGGSNYSLLHIHQLVSVPYAFFSRRSATASHALTGDSAVFANAAGSSQYSDTASYAMGAGFSDSAQYAHFADTAIIANQTYSADSAEIAGNGYSHISYFGDTLYFLNGSFVIVPGISGANGGVSPMMGCTSNAACNYNPLATNDNGSCYFRNSPCDDENESTVNDEWSENCLCRGIVIVGCINPDACNYNPSASQNDGSCFFQGDACNDNDGNTAFDVWSSSCECAGQILGCTNPLASNFDANALVDDGSCAFAGNDGLNCGAPSVLNPNLSYGSVTDNAGNIYSTIVINGHEWMAENLKVSAIDTVVITEAQDGPIWSSTYESAWCWPNSESSLECPYGKLYNFYVVLNEGNICPNGWHLSTDDDWSSLVEYYGGHLLRVMH